MVKIHAAQLSWTNIVAWIVTTSLCNFKSDQTMWHLISYSFYDPDKKVTDFVTDM
jgi:hypothetical protein